VRLIQTKFLFDTELHSAFHDKKARARVVDRTLIALCAVQIYSHTLIKNVCFSTIHNCSCAKCAFSESDRLSEIKP
jgi:ferredoxin-like protein FixX